MTTQPHVRSSARRTRGLRRLGVAIAAGALVASCTSDGSAAVDPAAELATYRSELAAICASTASSRSELVDPTDASTTAAFANSVSLGLTAEADAARTLRPPSDIDADHRAFVQNTDDQARAWSRLAATAIDDADAFGAVQDEILELTLGRDDLATDMGVDACRVTPPASS